VRQSEAVEAALRQGEQQLRALLQFAPLPIVIVCMADQTIRFANEHAIKQFKLLPEQIEGMRAGDFYVSLEDRDRLLSMLQQHGSVTDWEVRLKDGQGAPFWALLSTQCINYYGDLCLLTALNNIELRKRNQQELQRRAYHDELTGLPNRAMFMGTLDDTFARVVQDGGQFALMFLDLDRFKRINDELGHAAGDRLLQEVARRLKSSVGEGDIVARLGGDEFVILITHEATLGRIDQLASAILAVMALPIQLDTDTINITFSIGISCYPDDGTDLLSMMKCADAAMYCAKELGRNNFQWYGAERA
jgi:diguanylate cyclase (GGDEF)-like protein/PAS domain S-box-containing protein